MGKIEIFPRLHFSLISMFEKGYRQNGGLGVSINAPRICLYFKPSNKFKINTNISTLNTNHILEVLNTIKLDSKLEKCIQIEIEGNILSHYGFGSGTALSLGCIEALFLTNKQEYTNEQLITLSGRGGTSGIGVHTYFTGGFIFDLGHKNFSEKELKPSHASKPTSIPLLLTQLEIPDWPIGICIPKKIKPLTHEEERAFFKRVCPINNNAVYETTYHSLFGVLAAIKTKDYDTFCLSIKNLQNCEWKKQERLLHGSELENIEKQLYLAGADSVGMSSLGPTLFFMAKNMDSVIERLDQLPCEVYRTQVVNHGRVISNV